MVNILETQDLSFSWSPTRDEWFQHLLLKLEGGHIYGLMGRNGAGKTTMIKLLCGCLRPHSGASLIQVGGHQLVAAERRPEALAEIVFVPESADLPPVTPPELAKLVGPLYPRFSEDTFAAHLEALEIPRDVKIPRLSFGQRRKVHIAFALATNASLVFLDEPSNGLDIAAQIVLRKLLIAHIAADRSVVVSTHHVREFEHVVDEVLVLEHGRILAHESVAALQESGDFEDLESWYARLIGVSSSPNAMRTSHHERI